MFLSALLLSLPVQVPSDELQRNLASEAPEVRYAAALELSTGDAQAERWLLKSLDKGAPEVRRILLLAAALMGTQDSLEEVERAARKGRKTDPYRAYALLLYGAFHPDAGRKVKKDWARAASDFERACLLAGLLTHPEELADPTWASLVAKSREPALTDLLAAAALLREESWDAEEEEESLPLQAVRRLLTRLKTAAGGGFRQELEVDDMPPLWIQGARHHPGRSLEDLMSQALVEEHVGLVLALGEVAEEERQLLFDYFRPRVNGPQESAWLWGTAGELQLLFPDGAETELSEAVVAGFLSLALLDFARAAQECQSYLPAARILFAQDLPLQRRHHAGLLLALAGLEQDLPLLKQAFLDSSGVERQKLTPVWKFARRDLGAGPVRESWLRLWRRDLGAGWVGYIDSQAPRWVAYRLIGGTHAAEVRPELAHSHPKLEQLDRDYAREHDLYQDLAFLLLDGLYRWGLPGEPR